MNYIVCGSRDITLNNHSQIKNALERSRNEMTKLITGGAKGVDYVANMWGRMRKIPTEVYPADWKRYGGKAGYLRNLEMLDIYHPENTVVMAFWNKTSKGTQHMIENALSREFDVVVEYLDYRP